MMVAKQMAKQVSLRRTLSLAGISRNMGTVSKSPETLH